MPCVLRTFAYCSYKSNKEKVSEMQLRTPGPKPRLIYGLRYYKYKERNEVGLRHYFFVSLLGKDFPASYFSPSLHIPGRSQTEIYWWDRIVEPDIVFFSFASQALKSNTLISEQPASLKAKISLELEGL